MSTNRKGLRFDQILSEIDGGDVCSMCKTLLEPVNIPDGTYASNAALNLSYCKRCDAYHTIHRNIK